MNANSDRLTSGPAKKVTIYLNEDTSSSHDFLYREIWEFLLAHGVTGAALTHPDAEVGTTRHYYSQHLPVRIEFLESVERFEAIVPELCRMVTSGIIEAHDTTILKIATEPSPL